MSDPESKNFSQPQKQISSVEPPRGGLATFADALAARQVGIPDDPAADTEVSDDGVVVERVKPKTKPKDLAEAAAQLGVKDADLYALLVPSKCEGADPYTIGKLKDLAEEHDNFELSKLEYLATTRREKSEYLRAVQELEAITASLPADAIKPDVRAKLQQRRESAMLKERQLTLDTIPEWKNPDVRTLEIEQMIEHLKDNGFPDSYLEGIYDHKTLRYIRSNMQREQAIAAALEKVKERKPSTPPKSAAKGGPPQKQKSAAIPTREEQNHARFGAIINQATSR